MWRVPNSTYMPVTLVVFLYISVTDRPRPQPKRTLDLDVVAGETAFINVTVVANPSPSTEWFVGGKHIAQGSHEGRYVAHVPQSIGNGAYNVTLSIVNLEPQDAALDYELTATNQYGTAEYLVQLSAMPPPAPEDGESGGGSSSGGLFDVSGMVVLMSVAAVALLLALAMLGVARVTGRCCFGVGRRDETVEITQEKV